MEEYKTSTLDKILGILALLLALFGILMTIITHKPQPVVVKRSFTPIKRMDPHQFKSDFEKRLEKTIRERRKRKSWRGGGFTFLDPETNQYDDGIPTPPQPSKTPYAAPNQYGPP